MLFAAQVFLWLMFYSFAGWAYESALCSITEKKLVNRGFLNGPICPIYGFGALFIIFTLGQSENSLVSIFLSSAVLACALEYFTSWAMEKLFHARWWDYSGMRFHLNGRICLAGFLVFGLFGLVLLNGIRPWLATKVASLGEPLTYSMTGALLALSVSDAFATIRHVPRLDERLAEVQREMERFLGEARTRGEQWALEASQQLEWLRPTAERSALLRERFEQSAQARSERIHAAIGRRRYQDLRLSRAFPNLRHRHSEAWDELAGRMRKTLKQDVQKRRKEP